MALLLRLKSLKSSNGCFGLHIQGVFSLFRPENDKVPDLKEIMTQEPFLGEEQVKTLYIKAVGVKTPCLEKLILIFSDTLEHDFR